MAEKKLSVIVPVYNSEKYLSRCVDSLLSQTYKNIEIILIDDGSTDNSPEICDKYADENENIIVVHKKNGGVSSARNKGLSVISGEYIAYLDSDDFVDKSIYSKLINLIETKNSDICIGGFCREITKNEYAPYCKEKIEKYFTKEELLINLLKNNYFSCSIAPIVFSKNVVKDIRWNENIKYNEDLLYIFNAIKNSRNGYFTSEPLYYYCDNEGSATNCRFSKKKMTIIDVWDKILNEVNDENDSVKLTAETQYVRNNLMCAMFAVEGNYTDKDDFIRIQKNVRKHLKHYLLSDAASGYKFYALILSVSVNLFRFVKKHR